MFFFPPQADVGVGNTLGGGPIFGVGLLRQRGNMIFRDTASSIFTAYTNIISDSFSCNYDDSDVEVEFDLHYSTGGSGSDNDGFIIKLYVDGVDSGITEITSWVVAGTVQTKTGRFVYTPGDTDAHTYAIYAGASIGSIAAKNSWMRCVEYGPNPE